MPAGTPLYAPVDGVVRIAGGTPYYTFYGNGQDHVGELLIETADGDQVILGHLGRIAVDVGDEVAVGQFVGLSGGENGDHLHLEAREVQPLGAYKIVDPRKSFLVDALTAAAAAADRAADE
jgi:murein DD-endopeptidase MepM/ murein hydrolase activator NlpD